MPNLTFFHFSNAKYLVEMAPLLLLVGCRSPNNNFGSSQVHREETETSPVFTPFKEAIT